MGCLGGTNGTRLSPSSLLSRPPLGKTHDDVEAFLGAVQAPQISYPQYLLDYREPPLVSLTKGMVLQEDH